MNSGFPIAFSRLLAALGLLVAGCERPVEPEDQAEPQRTEDVHAAQSHDCASEEEDQARASIDQARAAAGAPAFFCLGKLSAMATAHASFLAQNESLSLESAHREQAGASGYTGNTLGQRAEHQGLDVAHFWIAEGAGGGDVAAEVVQAHLATVYHRSALLAPGGRYFAFALARGREPHAVMNMLLWTTVDGLLPSRWPAANAHDAPTGFNGSGERPEPVQNAEAAGYPVSVHFPRHLTTAGAEPELVVEVFELRDEDDAPVKTRLLTRGEDELIYPSDAFLVPDEPLQSRTTYRVTAKMRYGVFAFEESWTFETGARRAVSLARQGVDGIILIPE